ncbi:MAG: shikimate dehydrogenase [Geminicoccaceae bacterium]|nr:shikimate dehydrogenase [Geminicoccaceae bacterium]
MTVEINGHTQVIAHLGVPTSSFRAPMIYNPYFENVGINAVVVPMGCEPGDFPVFMRHVARLRNFAGALITMPHKVEVVKLLDEASTAVRICGACNAVRRDDEGRLVGEMFDGEGFVRGLGRKGRTAEGASALVIGAGGAGSAIAASLAGAGVSRIGLCDLRAPAVDALAARIAAHYPDVEIVCGTRDPSGWDIVTNATPLGMNAGDPLPLDVERIDPSTFVGEVVLTVEETPFLAACRARGCTTQVGTDMLFEQIPAYLEFFGFPTTTPQDLRRLARLVA